MQYAINEEHLRNAPPSLTQIAFVWFHRIIALICIFYGAAYWMKLIGIHDGPLSRYDLMPVHWQIAATSLAVLYPVAATGLWMVVSWGAVIWGAVAITEAIMYAGFPQLYGSNMTLLAAHGATAFLYLAFRLALMRENRINQ
jgi:Family of unknown function (DUF6163)